MRLGEWKQIPLSMCVKGLKLKGMIYLANIEEKVQNLIERKHSKIRIQFI